MRDIGRRIQRYRLSRYRPLPSGIPRPPRWVWLVAAAWLIYIGLLSDRSLYRIWRMGQENSRAEKRLHDAESEISRLDREAKDPHARQDEAEQALRREGFAKRGEIIYRIQPGGVDTTGRK